MHRLVGGMRRAFPSYHLPRSSRMSQRDMTAPSDDVPLQLNPLLTAETFSDEFRRKGRIHISGILTDAAARRLFRALERETPWGLICNEGDKFQEFNHNTVSAEDHQAM